MNAMNVASLYWQPNPIWKGQSAYLIGGGSSLRSFDFSLLRGKNTIGCNHAFELGVDVVKWVVFADHEWFNKVKHELKLFKGDIVSCSSGIVDLNLPWIHKMSRIKDGLQTEGTNIGWNNSSGAIAMNLAVRLGAERIYLLGYDLSADARGRTHWHARYACPSNNDSFQRFVRGFGAIKQGIDERFPHIQVFNVTDGSSNLKLWPAISFQTFRETLEAEERKIAA